MKSSNSRGTMKRLIPALTLLLIFLTGCVQNSAQTSSPVSAAINLTDGFNRNVSLTSIAKKIISLAPSNTEILYAIGAGSQLIGRDDFSDYPPQAKAVISVGGSMGKFNLEQIANLQPDLVLASNLNTPEQIKALEDLKLTVYVLPNPTTLESMYSNLETVGILVGQQEAAARLSASLKARQKKVADALSTTKGTPKVFYELDASEPSKPYTAGANTFIDILIRLAGGENVGSALKGDYPQISQEELLAQDPAIVLLGDAAFGVTPEQVAQRPGWSALRAVKENKIFAVDDNLISRPGPRLIDGLEALAMLIHPEAFK